MGAVLADEFVDIGGAFAPGGDAGGLLAGQGAVLGRYPIKDRGAQTFAAAFIRQKEGVGALGGVGDDPLQAGDGDGVGRGGDESAVAVFRFAQAEFHLLAHGNIHDDPLNAAQGRGEEQVGVVAHPANFTAAAADAVFTALGGFEAVNLGVFVQYALAVFGEDLFQPAVGHGQPFLRGEAEELLHLGADVSPLARPPPFGDVHHAGAVFHQGGIQMPVGFDFNHQVVKAGGDEPGKGRQGEEGEEGCEVKCAQVVGLYQHQRISNGGSAGYDPRGVGNNNKAGKNDGQGIKNEDRILRLGGKDRVGQQDQEKNVA